MTADPRVRPGFTEAPLSGAAAKWMPTSVNEIAAKIVQRAYAERRPVREITAEMTDLSDEELDRLLDARRMTRSDQPT